MSEPIAVVLASPPGFNPGMLFSELAARVFCERNGLASRTTWFRFVPIEERLGDRDAEARRIALERCDVGLHFETLDRASSLRGFRPLYWGDFLHMRQYVDAVSRMMARSGRAGAAEEILLLAGAAPEIVASTVSCGTTLLFNTASDLLDPAYGPLLASMVRGMKAILVRDLVSAAQLGDLTGEPERSFLGTDVTQLVTLLDDWREAFGPGVELRGAEQRVGLAFFARGSHRARDLSQILRRLGAELGVGFRWLPWGDRAAFPALGALQRKLRLAPMGGVESPALHDLIEAVARAEVVVTDTYHLAVIAWSMGTPAVMVPGEPGAGEQSVNAGHWSARIDKRYVFYAQHGLLELYLEPALLRDADRLEEAVRRIRAAIAERGIVAWHRAAVRRRAAWTEVRVREALGG